MTSLDPPPSSPQASSATQSIVSGAVTVTLARGGLVVTVDCFLSVDDETKLARAPFAVPNPSPALAGFGAKTGFGSGADSKAPRRLISSFVHFYATKKARTPVIRIRINIH